MKIRGREYSDKQEYLDELQQYRLDAMKEGRAEKEEELTKADDERIELEMDIGDKEE